MPGAPAKLRNVSGGLFKKEAEYDAASTTLAGATDGVLIHPSDRHGAWIERTPMYEGEMGVNVAGLGNFKRAAPTGFAHKGEWPLRFKGSGIAYTASVKSTIHQFMEAAGFDATLTATPGSEKFRFAPTPDGAAYASLASKAYQGGEEWASSGMICSLRIIAENGGPPQIMFPFVAIEKAMPADAAVPAITYPYTALDWPLSSDIAFNIGGYTVDVKKRWEFDLQRKIDNPRGGLNSTHRGFVPIDRDPVIRCVIEATALEGTPFHNGDGLDPYALWKAATSLSCNITIAGAVQYNRLKGIFAQCQLSGCKPVGGPSGEWEIEMKPSVSTPSANDDTLFDTD
jgi:hypothetical protein